MKKLILAVSILMSVSACTSIIPLTEVGQLEQDTLTSKHQAQRDVVKAELDVLEAQQKLDEATQVALKANVDLAEANDALASSESALNQMFNQE